MKLSSQAKRIYSQISKPNTKLGDLRKISKEIKKNHELAIELWKIKEFLLRQLAILIMDKKYLSKEFINNITEDINQHNEKEQNQLIDWFMANQLMKDKVTISFIESWRDSCFTLQRRVFWYYQARLRWMGKKLPDNHQLLSFIEKNILKEKPQVQWAMNFTAAWIGIYDDQYSNRCIQLGEKTGLYKDEIVSKGCTPNYLPQFIEIEKNKLMAKSKYNKN